MARYEESEGLPIGEVLKRARAREQLDISAVEEKTKIRIKYLRAMEQDEWDVLPNAAYAKGFLRTYASVLGLDADALVDEYRRQYEPEAEQGPYTFTEPVLEGRRPLAGAPRQWGPGPIIVAGAIAIVAVLLVLGLTGGGDEDKGGKPGKSGKQHGHEQRHEHHGKQKQKPAPPPEAKEATLRLEIHSSVQVCLVGDSGPPLVDDQVLSDGVTEGPYNASEFDLRFPSGYDREQFDLILGGKRVKVPETQGPTAFKVTPPDHVKQVDFPGLDCP